MTSLGCHVQGAVMPHPDQGSAVTALHGSKCRFLAKMPTQNEELMSEFKCFIKTWIKNNLIPLSNEVDVSFETWLCNTNYPNWRKQELTSVWEEHSRILLDKDFKLSSFIKDEVYPEFKPSRWINARSDVFKCYAGPYIKAIENVVYQLKYFIKKVPIKDRPSYLTNMLKREGAMYFATDFSTFESVFTKQMLEACEFQLYDHMLSRVPGGPEFCSIYSEALSGMNKLKSKYYSITVEAVRMSGEMSTSLGNGFTNLMLMLFMFTKYSKCTGVELVVEGDDGLGVFSGIPPASKDFEQLGCNLKLEFHQELEHASFCGLIFDSVDLINLTDPREVLVTFGWTGGKQSKCSNKNLLKLLRCKSLSLIHQYPGCPIIQALARYGLRMTRSVSNYLVHFLNHRGSRVFNSWERDQIYSAICEYSDERNILFLETGINTRILCEKLYGISISQQLRIESMLDFKDDLSPLIVDSDIKFHEHWKLYFDRYVVENFIQHSDIPNIT